MYISASKGSQWLWLLAISKLVSAHFVITQPGWRGNTLKTNPDFPDGMQSELPCGGLGVSENRTAYPLSGPGAIAIQPGWFANNQDTTFTIAIGLGSDPLIFPTILRSLRVLGPSNAPFPGTFCLLQISLPEIISPKEGDLATIQVIQLHRSGKSAYNCADIFFTDDESQLPVIDERNCYNSTGIRLQAMGELGTTSTGQTQTTLPVSSAGESAIENSRSELFQSRPTESANPSTTEEPATSQTEDPPSPETTPNAASQLAAKLSGLLGFLLLF
jgi:hypothetical protein